MNIDWKIKKKLVMAVAVGLLSLSAVAIPSRLDNSAPLDPVNSQDATVKGWIQDLVNHNNNVSGNPHIPNVGNSIFKASMLGDDPDGSGPLPAFTPGMRHLTLPLGTYSYVALHWGGGRGSWEAYYIGDNSGSYTFDAPNRNGLTSYLVFSPTTSGIPDGGATMAMFGLAMLALGRLNRSRLA